MTSRASCPPTVGRGSSCRSARRSGSARRRDQPGSWRRRTRPGSSLASGTSSTCPEIRLTSGEQVSGGSASIRAVLRELHISGLGVIADLELELGPGLNVLTGETGAGKTMVTVGLLLALGERGSASLVRDDASAARVQARFDATDEAGEWAEDGEVILARSIARDGRSTAPDRRSARDRVGARRAGRRPRRASRAGANAAVARARRPDGIPRSVRRRRASRRAGGVPGDLRSAARRPRGARDAAGSRPRAGAGARPPRVPGRRDRGGAPPRRRDRGAHHRGGPALARRAAHGAGSRGRARAHRRGRDRGCGGVARIRARGRGRARPDGGGGRAAGEGRGRRDLGAGSRHPLVRRIAASRPGATAGGTRADRRAQAAPAQVRPLRRRRLHVPGGGIRATPDAGGRGRSDRGAGGGGRDVERADAGPRGHRHLGPHGSLPAAGGLGAGRAGGAGDARRRLRGPADHVR